MEKAYPIFYAKVLQSKIQLQDSSSFKKYISQFEDNAEIEIMVRPKAKRRTIKQNRAYWGAVINQIAIAIANDTGQDADDVHDYFKTKFLQRKIINPATGELITVVGSTANLNTKEFTDFVEKCYNIAALPKDRGGWGLVLSEIGFTNARKF